MYRRTLLLFVVIYLDPSALLQFSLRQFHLHLNTFGFVDVQSSYSIFWNTVCSDAIRLTFPCPFGTTTTFQSRHKVTRCKVGRQSEVVSTHSFPTYTLQEAIEKCRFSGSHSVQLL